MWVAEHVVARFRRKYGPYHAFDWPAFIAHAGLSMMVTPTLTHELPCLVYDDTIVIAARLSRVEAAPHVWHEIGHWRLHSGDCRFWLTLSDGQYTLAKMERQAWEFALLYPVWE